LKRVETSLERLETKVDDLDERVSLVATNHETRLAEE